MEAIISEEAPLATKKVIAGKPFKLNGKSYNRGDSVNVTDLPDHKISQLLNQRFLRPALTNTPD